MRRAGKPAAAVSDFEGGMFVRNLMAASLVLALCAGGTVARAAVTDGSSDASSLAVPALAPVDGGAAASPYLTNHILADSVETAATLMPGADVAFGYNVPMAGRFGAYDGTSTGLFLSSPAVASPYAGLAGGGSYIGSKIALSDSVSLRFGEAMLNPSRSPYAAPAFSLDAPLWGSRLALDPRQVQTSLLGADWDFASWGGLDLIASHTAERNGFLGDFNANALARSANTSAVGMSAHVGFGGGWVTTFSYNQGITQLSLRPNALASTSTDSLQSRAYGFAVAKHGLFGDDDSLGLAVSRPLQVYAGGAGLAGDGFDTPANLGTGRQYAGLTNSAETDLEVGYVTTFMNGALALQANAGYQMNVPGLGGANSLSVISRAKINF